MKAKTTLAKLSESVRKESRGTETKMQGPPVATVRGCGGKKERESVRRDESVREGEKERKRERCEMK